MKKNLLAPLFLFILALCVHLSAEDDILIEDFEGPNYGSWKAEGTAFGSAPSSKKNKNIHRASGFLGEGFASSHLGGSLKPTGSLTSPEFTIERDYINLLLGGGPYKDSGVKLLIEGKEVKTILPVKGYSLNETSVPVKEYRGKKAQLSIYDNGPGYWGVVLVDHITQSNTKIGYEKVSKTIEVTQPLILFPIGKGTPRLVKLTDRNGLKLHAPTAALAERKENVLWWGYLDVSEQIGRTVTVYIEERIGTDVLGMIANAAEPRFILPKYDEPLRPQFHFSQMNGWNNDPNGMVWHDGTYHLFWQSNPLGKGWGNMYWGHATSSDMVNWSEQKRALRSGGGKGTPRHKIHPSMGFGACFSGGANVDKDNTAGWQKGDEDVVFLVVADTSGGESIAYSNDGGKNYQFWEGNPTAIPGRDAKVFWYEPGKHWVSISYINNKTMAIYNSFDLKKWTEASKIKGFHECPELFELHVDGDPKKSKWILFGAHADYMIGDFDGKTYTPTIKEKRSTIHGRLVYAGQCFSNTPNNRQVYIGWAKVDMEEGPFNQGFSLPLDLSLKTLPDGSTHMFAQPVKELEKLRETPEIDVSALTLNTANSTFKKPLKDQLYDICMTITMKGKADSLNISVGKTNFTYEFSSQTFNGKPAPMTGDSVTLRILVDRPFIEWIAADGYSYELMKRRDGGKKCEAISISSKGPKGSSVIIDSLKVFPMKSIWGQ
ncbi:MAG: glycoside hydrolase family 32 protein [Planctomycetes bacterium]|nr:glycoside hydrolase family 32 protein [Planctomycetota bacterium]